MLEQSSLFAKETDIRRKQKRTAQNLLEQYGCPNNTNINILEQTLLCIE